MSSANRISYPYGGRYCCVVDCSNNQYRDIPRGIKFHSFPKDEERKRQWALAVNRVDPNNKYSLWQPKQSDVICSEHFAEGKKSDVKGSAAYIPSIFPTNHRKRQYGDDTPRAIRRQRLEETRQAASDASLGPFEDENMVLDQETDTVSDGLGGKEIEAGTSLDDQLQNSPPTSLSTDFEAELIRMDVEPEKSKPVSISIKLDYATQTNFPPLQARNHMVNCCDNVSNSEKATQATHITTATRDFQSQTVRETTNKEDQYPFQAYDNKKFKAMCGVRKEFVSFILGEINVQGRTFSESRLLSPESKLTLMFMKFRLNLPFTVLAAYHGISEASARNFFYEALDLMYEVAKEGVVWFDRSTIKARMPSSFKALYPDTRAIIDCSEIECETPSDVRQQVLMYSSYKSRHTIKFLIACAPSGEVTFCSKTFGGRTTDTHITTTSGFLNLLEEGDTILSDKGFPQIETKLNQSGCILVIPPFKKGNKQFTPSENREAYQCAKVRIHVERCIERLKRFEIMTFVPYHLFKHMDKVLLCVCFICNCFPDLIRDDSEDIDD